MSETNNEPPAKQAKRNKLKCIRCNIFIRKTTGVPKYIGTRDDAIKMYEDFQFHVQVNDIICAKCRSRLRCQKSLLNKSQKTQGSEPSTSSNAELNSIPEQEMESEEIVVNEPVIIPPLVQHNDNSELTNSQVTNPDVPSQSSSEGYVEPTKIEVEMVNLSFKRVVISHMYCFLCKSQTNIQDVPFEARIQVFVARRIFIPRRNRCCRKHLIKDRFYNDEVQNIIPYANESSIEVTELSKFLDQLSDQSTASLHGQIGRISEERVKALTGLSWENIFSLQNKMTTMRNSENRNITQALITFLFKLRTGNSNHCIAAILDLEDEQVARSIESVLKCFEVDVLPKYFGIDAYSRDFFMSRTATVASRLHDLENHLGLICDASYVRHQKSNNNAYQRKSYSGQKKTHLCKPFTICTTDGYVVDVAGPFTANKNDAQILEHLMSDPNGLVKILREGDTFILDRGFRDVTSLLEEKGYKVLMPALKGKRNQLTTAESNQSRLVTKIRWVVEAVHGIIGQKFKLLHHQLHNSILKNAGLYCKIACLLHNLFGKRLNSDSGRLDQIIDRINASKDLQNTLAQEVENNNWNRKTVPFQSLSSAEIFDFPEMTIEDLKIFFTGSYQLSQAVSYLSEMLEEDNTLRLSYAKEQHDIIRFEVRSRHINSKVYKSYLQYQPDSVGLNGVRRYCCNCANGNRTIGCCSHIAAIVFYLSHARYLSRIIRPAEILTTLFDFEEITPVIEEDSDEED